MRERGARLGEARSSGMIWTAGVKGQVCRGGQDELDADSSPITSEGHISA